MDLAVVRVGQLRALLLWSDAGEAAESVTQTELPLVLTAAVRQTPSHTAQSLGSGGLLVTKEHFNDQLHHHLLQPRLHRPGSRDDMIAHRGGQKSLSVLRWTTKLDTETQREQRRSRRSLMATTDY